jgi:FixJ family two-component response regulator
MSGKKIRVAVVDDDPSLCRAVSRLLHAAGMEPRTYSSAEEFLGETRTEPPACLLLDVHLTGISGFDLQRRLTSEGQRVPVVFISAFDEPDARRQARELGCVDFLLKTDAGDLVLNTIRRAAGMLSEGVQPMQPALCV